jgi:flagellar FliJ protein
VSDLRPLELAADMAKRQRDEVARRVAQRQAQRQSATLQLQQLQAYVVETENKWIARTMASDAAVMHHHYQFLEKLQHAIGYQERVIQTHASQIAQAQSALVEAEHKLKRFQHVLDTRKSTIADKRMRQEQKQMDEMASRMAARQSRQAKEHI